MFTVRVLYLISGLRPLQSKIANLEIPTINVPRASH